MSNKSVTIELGDNIINNNDSNKDDDDKNNNPTTTTNTSDGESKSGSSGGWLSWLNCCLCHDRSGPIPIDPKQDNKATELRILSFERPYMRAFHCSWISFFVSFFVWFSIVALLPYIQDTLHLTNNEIWISNIFNLIPLERFVIGPIVDRYGPRRCFLVLLCMASIPTALTGLVNTAWGLYILRLFIGIAGGSFVICQYWSTSMFAPEIVGQANGFVGGWGNLGGGVTQLVVGTGFMPLFMKHMSAERAWRTVSLIPAGMAIVTGVVVYFISDDIPTRQKHRRSIRRTSIIIMEEEQKQKQRDDGSTSIAQRQQIAIKESKDTCIESFTSAAKRIASWILFFHYMVTFGVELTMLGAISKYFTDVYGLDNGQASAVASIFGWMNLFARGMGGWASDYANRNMEDGMKGRIIVHSIFLGLEGILVLLLPFMSSFVGALIVMIFFSIFVQAAEGTTFGIVPYVDTNCVGAVSGIVSSGGNIGGIIFTSLFIFMEYNQIFFTLGGCALISIPLCYFIKIGDEDVVVGGGGGDDVDGRMNLTADDDDDNVELAEAETEAATADDRTNKMNKTGSKTSKTLVVGKVSSDNDIECSLDDDDDDDEGLVGKTINNNNNNNNNVSSEVSEE